MEKITETKKVLGVLPVVHFGVVEPFFVVDRVLLADENGDPKDGIGLLITPTTPISGDAMLFEELLNPVYNKPHLYTSKEAYPVYGKSDGIGGIPDEIEVLSDIAWENIEVVDFLFEMNI